MTKPQIASFQYFLELSKSSFRRVSLEIANEDFTAFPNSYKLQLKTGGNVVAIILIYMFKECSTAFSAIGFSVINYPYGIAYNPNAIT